MILLSVLFLLFVLGQMETVICTGVTGVAAGLIDSYCI